LLVRATSPDVYSRNRGPVAAAHALPVAERFRSFATRTFPVNPMLSTLPTLLVTTLYYSWNLYRHEWRRRQRALRLRVAYMLWVAAQRMGDRAAS
jgi:hypothetical protein